MKSKFLLFLLSFFTFSSAANVQDSNDQVSRNIYPANKIVFENKHLRDYLFEMIDIDLSLRLVSKDFKEGHDQYCVNYLSKIDPRIRNYLKDIRVHINDENHFRLEVPLYYLFSKYLRPYSSNINTFHYHIQNEFLGPATLGPVQRNTKTPGYLLYFYILVKNCFILSKFNQISFPTKALLLEAVKGLYPDPYCEEIVRDFDTNSDASLAHWALSSGRVDLARIILNKPDVCRVLGYYTDTISYMNNLHFCADMGEADLIDRCLEMGADPFRVDRIRRYRPMHYAVYNGHLEAVKRLFKADKGALVSSYSTLSPLLIAVSKGKSDIVEFFLSQPEVTLIGDPSLSANVAELALAVDDVKMAQVLLNSGKLELSEEILNRLQFIALRELIK